MSTTAKTTNLILATALLLAGATAFSSTTQAALPTTFRCIKYNNGFATVAQRGDRTTPPAITWNATLGQYTPEQRCQQVSQKLTQVVALNGGKLRHLVLKTGTVNRQKVVCVINSSVSTACNSANLLFTLQPKNAKRPEEVVAKLQNFSVMGTGAPVVEFMGTTPRVLFGVMPLTSNVNSLSLERLNQFLGSEESSRDSS